MNPEPITELMNIANCGVRLRHPTEIRYREVKPHWWSRKTVQIPYEYTPAPEHYHLDASLKAIEALGETGNPQAHEFLERIYTPDLDYQSERYFVSGGSEPRDDDWKYLFTVSVVYPNAQGELYDALKYEVSSRDVYEDDDDGFLDEDVVEKFRRGELHPPDDVKAHVVVQTALAKLKKALVT